MDVLLLVLALLFLVGGLIMNMFGSMRGTTAQIWLNLIGDLLMILGLILLLSLYMPKGNLEGYQTGAKGEYYALIIGLTLAAFFVGLILNMFGMAREGTLLNFLGDGLMLLGVGFMFMLFAPPNSIERFQTWVKTPSAVTTTTATTPTTIPDPQNPRYNSSTGEVTVDNLPSGTHLVVYWKGGTTPPEGPPFNTGTLGGGRFGAVQTAQIGQNATNVRVRFATPDHKGLSKVVNVP